VCAVYINVEVFLQNHYLIRRINQSYLTLSFLSRPLLILKQKPSMKIALFTFWQLMEIKKSNPTGEQTRENWKAIRQGQGKNIYLYRCCQSKSDVKLHNKNDQEGAFYTIAFRRLLGSIVVNRFYCKRGNECSANSAELFYCFMVSFCSCWKRIKWLVLHLKERVGNFMLLHLCSILHCLSSLHKYTFMNWNYLDNFSNPSFTKTVFLSLSIK